MIQLHNCKCENMIGQLPQVDAVIVDPPFGVTNNAWDKVIPFDVFWALINSCLKPNGVVVSFAMEPFASRLRMSNLAMYKYDIVWNKTKPVGFLNAKKRPLNAHEMLCVFYARQPTYNPLRTEGDPYYKAPPKPSGEFIKPDNCYRPYLRNLKKESKCGRYPSTVWTVSNFNGCKFGFSTDRTIHPTQKPVWLMERLICTYTNPGETVLDFCMGSGTTGVACVRQGRNFVGIESDKVSGFFDLAKTRIEKAEKEKTNA